VISDQVSAVSFQRSGFSCQLSAVSCQLSAISLGSGVGVRGIGLEIGVRSQLK